ncbi:hypothetical protein BDQ17DRAFT_1542465 [Cyathus striatus]|nr:hypothetical protein BDQ17DRAFT_1542465 [Cyathus striatus]
MPVIISQQSYLPWKICMTVAHVMAILTACLRIEYRRRSRRIWWDDYAAFVPAVTEALNAVLFLIRLRHFSDEENQILRTLKVRLVFANIPLSVTILWWSRISMSLAIVRITPEWSKSRAIAIYATFTFILTWAVLVISYMLLCTVNNSWQYANSDILICVPTYQRGIAAGISTDIASDIYLAVLPLYHLWRLRLSPPQRRLVRLVFSTSLLTLIVVVIFLISSYGGIFEGPGSSFLWLMIMRIEEAVSLIASNLTVLLSWGYKAFFRDTDIDDQSNKYITPLSWARSSQSTV